jgi:enoyl-CoA hydratase/carnithine racemase
MSVPDLSIDGGIATITLRRPQEANRIGPEDLVALAGHIATVNASPDVLVLRLQATGKYFCSGYDIGRMGEARAVEFEDMVDAIEQARPVTIAAIQGGVYGGATDMALACDFRIGAEGIDMFMPAARLGLHYYRSGMERYVSRMGLNAALRLFLTAERLDAAEMKTVGYLTHLVSAEEMPARLEQLATSLAAMAPLALLGMKKNLNCIARGTLDSAEIQRDIEATIRSADFQEGRIAWAEKRVARFTGR